MLVLTTEPECLEMGPGRKCRRNFRPKRGDAKVVSPYLTVLGVLQDLCLKGRLVVDAKGVYDTIGLVLDPGETADPFPTVS